MPKFDSIVSLHVNRYPRIQIEDVYKLAYQAAMGSEHVGLDSSIIFKTLVDEINELDNDLTNEPVFDPISPNGEILRVHISPYSRSNGDINELARSFQQTVSSYRGRTELLEEYWDSAKQSGKFPATQMKEYFATMGERNYPPVHHSAAYRQAYKPAYRVVWKKFLPIVGIKK